MKTANTQIETISINNTKTQIFYDRDVKEIKVCSFDMSGYVGQKLLDTSMTSLKRFSKKRFDLCIDLVKENISDIISIGSASPAKRLQVMRNLSV